ncbi:MAG TPA: NUDIX hydrolase [Acidimicrobiales bacterium]|nr:NUDIX hydrolase [Acidimicrobiales bacterium]
MSKPDALVRAAGGIIWRDRGALEVVVVHRPSYDDWSFPKGKREPGESDEECAVREVAEETGLLCDLGAELPTVAYNDRNGREKQVRYWAMQLRGAAETWDDEVDVLCWMRPVRAARVLSYERDASVLDAFCLMAGSAAGEHRALG